MMDWKRHPSFDGHEDVVFVGSEAVGYAGIVAIHSTALGPPGGGVRMWNYPQEADALTDALRLSRGITYKNAMAELPMGGGKSVIYRLGADRAAAFEKFGAAVEALGGRYVAAEDVGATVSDMRAIARRTAYVAGIPKEGGRAGGAPPPWKRSACTCRSRRCSAVRCGGARSPCRAWGRWGFGLCRLLAEEGAKLIVADVNAANLQRAQALGTEAAPVDRIHSVGS